MTVKVGIVSAKDGLIKVVISESKSPPLLGAKAVRVRLSQIYHLLPTRSPRPGGERLPPPFSAHAGIETRESYRRALILIL